MNVITYLFCYFFPTKQILSVCIATPLANTLSPYLVHYMIGPTYISPSLVNATTYIIVQPISDITYKGWEWMSKKPITYIELMPLKKQTENKEEDDEFEFIL